MANEWQYCRVRLIRSYLELLNGTDTDNWCKSAYNYVCRIEKELKGRYDELCIDVCVKALRKEDGNGAE